MPSRPPPPSEIRSRLSSERGSLLIVALLFAAAISLVLVSYLDLGRTTLKVAHRSYFASDAANLAEAGLEEAIYCFNQMTAGTPAATAWSGWTISGTDAMYTLPPFNRDQNAVGLVKVYVTGYDGSAAAPTVFSQATVTPFDGGAPIVKTLQIALTGGSATSFGLVALNGLKLNNTSFADAFNSNPSGSPTGPWRPYSAAIGTPTIKVAVLAGTISIASGKIYGDLYLGPGVAPPPSSDYSGKVVTNYTTSFPMPTYPTPASVSKSYNVGSFIPGMLPRMGDLPASDGRYYYFCSYTTIRTVTITTGKRVTIVGTKTAMGAGMTIQSGSSCHVYMDGVLSLSGGADLNNFGGWAGALQIFTTSSGKCSIGNDSQLVCCLYAPYAQLAATGSTRSSMLVGYYVARTINVSGDMDFHYDEAINTGDAGGSAGSWTVSNWLELQSAADRATVAGLTNNYLR